MSGSNEQLREQLRSITLALLDRTRPAYSLRSEVLELKSIFEEASGRTFRETVEDISAGETRTPGGVAVSPIMAAMCVDDFARTVQFIRGTYDAVLEARHTIKDRPVRVLYAGCGPWATLAVPLMCTLSPEETIFTLLDIHVESTQSVERLVENLDLSHHVADFVTADAGEYKIASDDRPDMIVIEMLRAALEAEPQVAVARHLLGQAPAAVMIPEEVRIDLALVNQSREFVVGDLSETAVRDRILIGTPLVLNKAALASLANPSRLRLSIPEFDEAVYRPMLLTNIRVFGNNLLADYDSGITCPKALSAKQGGTIEFFYELTGRPGLRARRV